MVDCWAVEVAEHGSRGWRSVVVWVACEDEVPLAVELVDFWCPQVCAVICAWRRVEDKLLLCIAPVGQRGTPEHSDVGRCGECHKVLSIVLDHEWVRDASLQNGICVGVVAHGDLSKGK